MKILNETDFEMSGSHLRNKLEIKNISEYYNYILYFQQKWNQDELWYRGVTCQKYKLIPSIYRKSTWNYDSNLAYSLFHEFIRKAKRINTQGNNFGKWEWYQIQQHYGLPTRLLDWTESNLIALFFSVRTIDSDDCSCVWILEPFQLNQISIGERKLLYTDKLIKDSYDQIVNNYLFDNNKIPLLPIAVLPTYIDDRFISQKSCFTIHGLYEDGFDQAYFEDKKNFKLVQLIISNSSKIKIKNELASAGISETTLFPDLEGLARELKHKYGMK